MIIKWVRLKNIRSYLSEEIRFSEGSTLLSGDIGAGKSTILLAVEFALFGFTNEISGDTLLRNGKQNGSVELCIEVEGKEIIIKRNLKRGKDSILQPPGSITIDGLKSEKSAEELKAAVLQILGYPEEYLKKKSISLYRYTVYTPQEEMKRILFEGREDRLKILRKIFGIEKYGTIRANAMLIASSLREAVRALEAKISDLEEKLKEEAELKGDVQEAKQKLVQLRAEIESKAKEIQEAERALLNIEERRKTAAELLAAIRIYEEQIRENAAQHLAKKKRSEEIKEEIEALQKKISEIPKSEPKDEAALERELELLSREREALERELEKNSERAAQLVKREQELKLEVENAEALSEKLSEKRKELEGTITGESRLEIEKREEALEEELRRVSERKAALLSQKSEAEKIISEIAKNDRCPLCKQGISHEYREHMTSEEKIRISKIEEEVAALQMRGTELLQEIAELKRKISKKAEAESRAMVLKAEIEAIEVRLSELNKKKELLAKVRTELAEIKNFEELKRKAAQIREEEEKKRETLRMAREANKKIEELKRLSEQLSREKQLLSSVEEEYSKLKKLVAELNTKKLSAEKQLAKIKIDDKEYENARQRRDALAKEEKGLEALSAALTSEVRIKEERIRRISAEIKEKSNDKKKMKFYSEIEDMLSNKFTELMAAMEKQVMSSIHYEFGKLFEEWFSALMEEEAMSARIDEDFTPIVTQDGHDTSVENLSGGEKTAVALAYRLALNRVINDMAGSIKTRNIIILDEPTDGFSSEQLDRVREVLEQLKLKQVILVSHEPKIESFVENVIRIVKQGHQSRVLSAQ
ncbi:MAG: SMC family ATPase [Candidatus Woesearchaeota archaeon]